MFLKAQTEILKIIKGRGNMRFEVKKNNKTVMQTIEENCIPDKETRDDMRRAGYKLYLDGKIYKEKSR